MNRRIYYDAGSGRILMVTDGKQTVLQEVALYRIAGYAEGDTLVLEKEVAAIVLRNLKNYRIDLETLELEWTGEGPEPGVPGGGGSGGGGTGVDTEVRKRVDDLEAEVDLNNGQVTQHIENFDIHRKITAGTTPPSNGGDGDVYFRYE